MFPAIAELWLPSPPAVADPRATAGTADMAPPSDYEGTFGGGTMVAALPGFTYMGQPMLCNCTCGINLFRCGLSELGQDVLLIAHTLLHTHVPRGIWFRALVAFWLTWSGAPASTNRLPLEHVTATVFECFNNSYTIPSEYRDAMCNPDPTAGCRSAALTLLSVCEASRLRRAWSALASLPVEGEKLRFVLSDLLTAFVPSLMAGHSRYAGGLANLYTLFTGLNPAATSDLVRLAFSVNEWEDPTTNLPTFSRDHSLHKYDSYRAYAGQRSNPDRLRGRKWGSASEYMAARALDGGWHLNCEIPDKCLASGRTHSVSAVNESIYIFEHLTVNRRCEDSDTGAVQQGFIPSRTFDAESESPGGRFCILWAYLASVCYCWDASSIMPTTPPATAKDLDQLKCPKLERSCTSTSKGLGIPPNLDFLHTDPMRQASDGVTPVPRRCVGLRLPAVKF
ncbi:hypothetical protein MY10362_008885 [Beauveria mimosiformis]